MSPVNDIKIVQIRHYKVVDCIPVAQHVVSRFLSSSAPQLFSVIDFFIIYCTIFSNQVESFAERLSDADPKVI